MNNQNESNDQLIPQVTVDKLDSIIADNNYKVIDVRNRESIEKQGNIPNAINIPFDTVENAIDKNHSEYHPVFDSNGPFLFCCTGGVMSYSAAIKAQESGVKNILNLEGGHAAWAKLKKTPAQA